MNNQTKCGEREPQATTIFSAFGTPEKIFMDGDNITDEIVKNFGGDGRYPSKIDNGVCHKCHGSGIAMPRLTDKKLSVFAKFFSEAEE